MMNVPLERPRALLCMHLETRERARSFSAAEEPEFRAPPSLPIYTTIESAGGGAKGFDCIAHPAPATHTQTDREKKKYTCLHTSWSRSQ